MPIKMVSEYGSYESKCLMEYPRNFDAIPPECSYEWEGDKPQPKCHINYTPKLVNITQR
jgi:hypothetical protein